jgi:hypothetical protein
MNSEIAVLAKAEIAAKLANIEAIWGPVTALGDPKISLSRLQG